jgi:hypothetical protein
MVKRTFFGNRLVTGLCEFGACFVPISAHTGQAKDLEAAASGVPRDAAF